MYVSLSVCVCVCERELTICFSLSCFCLQFVQFEIIILLFVFICLLVVSGKTVCQVWKLLENGKQCLKCLKSNENLKKSGNALHDYSLLHCCLCLTSGLSFGRFQSEQNSQTHQNTSKTKVSCGKKKRGEHHHTICTFFGCYRTLSSISRSLRVSWGFTAIRDVQRNVNPCEDDMKVSCRAYPSTSSLSSIIQSTVAFTYLERDRKKERERNVIDITVC